MTAVCGPAMPLLDDALRARARAVAGALADRVVEPDSLRRAFDAARTQTTFLSESAFDPRSLAGGNAGAALMFGAFAGRDVGRHVAADAHLRAALAVEPLGAGPSLFGGTAGLLAAARVAARGVHYPGLIARLQGVVDELAVGFAERLEHGVERDTDYDLISGASGVLGETRDAVARARLARALAALATQPGGTGWRALSRFGDLEVTGNNLGLAHGAAGMIASLARCADVDGVAAGVESLVEYTLAHCFTRDGVAVDTPPFVGASGRPAAGRAAWCYGAPGMAVALLAAGDAFDLPLARRAARELFEHVAIRTEEELGIHDDALCHGRAGVALALALGAGAFRSANVRARSISMFAALTGRFDPGLPFGYRAAAPDGTSYDDAALLTGSTGIALALLVAAGDASAACLSPFHLGGFHFESDRLTLDAERTHP
jgi:hypothetical protein